MPGSGDQETAISTKWPIPTHSPLDAGPFITAGVVIARDPESGRHNLSYNRMQIYGPDRAGVSMNIWRHIKAFFDKIEPQGKNLPFAVALGPDPVVMMAAAFRYDGDEYEVAGACAARRFQWSRRSPATSWCPPPPRS